ncbi:hypothetical protein FQZ97_1162080 [compost metagenome]
MYPSPRLIGVLALRVVKVPVKPRDFAQCPAVFWMNAWHRATPRNRPASTAPAAQTAGVR